MHNQLQNNHNLLAQISNEGKTLLRSREVFSLCVCHCNENKVNDITSNKSTNVVKGERSSRLEICNRNYNWRMNQKGGK